MPAIARKPNISLPRAARRGGGNVVGLDIQPGYIAAVQAHINGGVTVQHAAGAPLPPDALREGEVLDERTLSDALRELFAGGNLSKRVRVGLANQRTVLRTLELPPVTDRKELAAAVRFQAEDQVPMPLAQAVLDFHSLGIIDTPNGPRQRVIVVAAQREMVERLLRAVRHAGLRPEGIDLSAFALIRSLYQPAANGTQDEGSQRMLYLNIGGLTNMAIAEGRICRFTRVVGGGLEAMAAEIAERRGIPLVEARKLLADYDLARPVFAEPAVALEAVLPPPVPSAPSAASEQDDEPAVEFHGASAEDAGAEDASEPPLPEVVETWALAQDPQASVAQNPQPSLAQDPEVPPTPAEPVVATTPQPAVASDPDVRMVLENGIREIVGEVRNSLDFHRSQDGGGEVTTVVLSGPVLEMAGFAEALEADLGIPVRRQSVGAAAPGAFAAVSEHRLAIAAGLAAEEAPR
ncbi:MAG TPA: type IV pilus assembly protein PilM [Solirubrobacteraceae bacterium]|jgi:type IV pilus assembly protein PilM